MAFDGASQQDIGGSFAGYTYKAHHPRTEATAASDAQAVKASAHSQTPGAAAALCRSGFDYVKSDRSHVAGSQNVVQHALCRRPCREVKSPADTDSAISCDHGCHCLSAMLVAFDLLTVSSNTGTFTLSGILPDN